MKVFEITLIGFEGGTSDTDHLVKWIKAKDETKAKELADSVFKDYEWWGEIHEGCHVSDDACDVIQILEEND